MQPLPLIAILASYCLALSSAFIEEPTVPVKDGSYYIVSGEFGTSEDNKYLSLYVGSDYLGHIGSILVSAGATAAFAIAAMSVHWIFAPCFLLGAATMGLFTFALGLSTPTRKDLTLLQGRKVEWIVSHTANATRAHQDAFVAHNGWEESKFKSMPLTMRSHGSFNTLGLHATETVPFVAVQSDIKSDMVYLLAIGHEMAQPDLWIHLANGDFVTLDKHKRSLWKFIPKEELQ